MRKFFKELAPSNYMVLVLVAIIILATIAVRSFMGGPGPQAEMDRLYGEMGELRNAWNSYRPTGPVEPHLWAFEALYEKGDMASALRQVLIARNRQENYKVPVYSIKPGVPTNPVKYMEYERSKIIPDLSSYNFKGDASSTIVFPPVVIHK